MNAKQAGPAPIITKMNGHKAAVRPPNTKNTKQVENSFLTANQRELTLMGTGTMKNTTYTKMHEGNHGKNLVTLSNAFWKGGRGRQCRLPIAI